MSTTTTATTPVRTPSTIALKAGASPPSMPESSGISADRDLATLRSLYPRAAKAFLHRDNPLAHSLLSSAFSHLYVPTIEEQQQLRPDALSVHRKKWDLLRITLETTVYASPPPNLDALPSSLRANQLLSPPSLLNELYTRSLRLFTPEHLTPSAEYLPSQILLTLALASMKLDCPDAGRSAIEEWLAKRVPPDLESESATEAKEGYEKVLELYVLHLLPRLNEWEYASDFLAYESELAEQKRQHLRSALLQAHARHLDSLKPQVDATATLTPSSCQSPSRTPSPSPSSSSHSSTSTHTATPRSPRLAREHDDNNIGSESGTITPKAKLSSQSRDKGKAKAKDETVRNSSRLPPRSRSVSPLPRPPLLTKPANPPTSSSPARARPKDLLTLLIRSLPPLLASPSRLLSLLFFVLIPLLSFLFKFRSRNRLALSSSNLIIAGGQGGAGEVKKRLAVLDRPTGLRWLVGEVGRAVGDVVRMGGGGLG